MAGAWRGDMGCRNYVFQSPRDNFTMQAVLLLCQGTVMALSEPSQECPNQTDFNITKSGHVTRNDSIATDGIMD